MTDRILELLPTIQSIARSWLVDANTALAATNAHAIVSDAWRTASQQFNDHANGSSGVNLGYHNYGLAWDFLIVEADGTVVQDGNDPRYAMVGQIAADKYGCKYGIRLPNGEVDHDHIEYHPGFTLAQYQAYLETHNFPRT